MKRIFILLIISFLVLFACVNQRPYDIILFNGTIIDGTGKSGMDGSIGVLDGKMYLLPKNTTAKSNQIINVENLVIAPGFVDVHNHTERALINSESNLNEAFIRQGVTTILGGPDGSLGPNGIQKLIGAMNDNGAGTNVATYVGHNAIRRDVMKDDYKRYSTEKELDEMRKMVQEGMKMGAVGFSTGLMYNPGNYASKAEVIALAKEVEPYGGIYDSHVRNPVHDLIGSDREVIEVSNAAGIGGKIGHLKSVGLHNAGKIKEVIALVDSARDAGLNIVSDQYPYDGAATARLARIFIIPKNIVPTDFPEVDDNAFEERSISILKNLLKNKEDREQIRIVSENGEEGSFAWLKATGYTSMRITHSQDFPELIGIYLSQLAEQKNQKPFDAISELLLKADNPIYITLGAIKEKEVQDLLVQPWNMVASDGAYSLPGDKGGHPRSTGTFPRVLGHYVRELQILSLEEAIRKMTSFPADFIGLEARGRIANGLPADIAVFNPETIIDKSTFVEPNYFSEGVIHVLVNGQLVLFEEEITGKKPGIFLKKQ
tara:strand:- start:126 stop:1760 length:1635 start_codon:yes stop_codon:yes gene_type:complete